MGAENSKLSAGKRRPGRPFRKGQSGNPGGRPRLEGEIRALAQKHAPAALARLVELSKSENERVAVAAAQAVLDRACGKPQQVPQIDDETVERGFVIVVPAKEPIREDG